MPGSSAGFQRDDDLGALARRQPHVVGGVRRFEKSAVGGDEGELPHIVEGEVVGAGAGPVEDPEPHELGGHVEDGAPRAIREHGVAEQADLVALAVELEL
ncbi:MAG: hypothetical protein K0S05_1855, partial [Agromyces sp.]|nr:hypothetical protein [Agromyces sp.]